MHLGLLPLETTVITDFLAQNIRNCSIQTAISQVPRFLAEVEKFSTYLWRVGVFVGGLERRLRYECLGIIACRMTFLEGPRTTGIVSKSQGFVKSRDSQG